MANIIDKFHSQYDKLKKDFNEVSNKLVGENRVISFKHKSLPVSATMTLIYGQEVLINRAPLLDLKVGFDTNGNKELMNQMKASFLV